jgi:hypothetical protein
MLFPGFTTAPHHPPRQTNGIAVPPHVLVPQVGLCSTAVVSAARGPMCHTAGQTAVEGIDYTQSLVD